jgi:hypothetical protein
MSSESAVATRRDPRDKFIRRGTAGSHRQHTAGELILQVSLVVAIAPPAPPCDIGECFRPLGRGWGAKWTSGRSFCMFGVSDGVR